MSADERAILEFYHLQTPYPETWPAENNSEGSDSENEVKAKIKRRKSRYQALERAVTNRRSTMGGEAGGKVGGLVQKDEPDPLGASNSVVKSLRQLGVRQVQDSARISMT